MRIIPFSQGCAICGSTWGDYWRAIDGDRMFFCCNICADQFENMVNEVKKRTGWNKLIEITITGDYRGRDCVALGPAGTQAFKFSVRFDSKGNVSEFHTS